MFYLCCLDKSLSSRGLGHRPFTAVTGVRIPVGTPNSKKPLTYSVAFLLSVHYAKLNLESTEKWIHRPHFIDSAQSLTRHRQATDIQRDRDQ